MRFVSTVFVIYFIVIIYCAKLPKPRNETKTSSKFNNPNFIRDRYKYEIVKPYWNESWQNRFKKPFHPAWMDYCDPYHCNDYHRIACGLNRRTMRFKWFQSVCHIILNNMCSSYRGHLKYDLIDTKYCVKYVLHLRMGCPKSCKSVDLDPVCAVSSIDDQVVKFKSMCHLNEENCRQNMQEYEEVDMDICDIYL